MTENLCILNHVILSRLISISTLNMRKQDLGGRGVNEDNDGAAEGGGCRTLGPGGAEHRAALPAVGILVAGLDNVPAWHNGHLISGKINSK